MVIRTILSIIRLENVVWYATHVDITRMKVASGISLLYYRNKYQTQSEWEVVTLSPLIGAFCRPDFTSINIHARVAILSCIGRARLTHTSHRRIT